MGYREKEGDRRRICSPKSLKKAAKKKKNVHVLFVCMHDQVITTHASEEHRLGKLIYTFFFKHTREKEMETVRDLQLYRGSGHTMTLSFHKVDLI